MHTQACKDTLLAVHEVAASINNILTEPLVLGWVKKVMYEDLYKIILVVYLQQCILYNHDGSLPV